ncbi:hypothetical protein LCGC14_2208310, partial [marine sediment metagenome]
MKIQVWKRYEGNRVKKPIEVEVYDIGDRKLQGLARYLIDNGNAFRFATSPEDCEAPEG